ncbi:2-hydroxychromene-2-carboxylate isomerase [Sinorhizobium fredii USDA 205]|uniref:2-hydroxychromene-2-carboxylate isomerase n=1 Tax=Rhizobium fredii TaxID=380 RepID=A0A844ADQ0_RHIFR|nr:DsbA family protein [Sinorhizobium fredii]KSV83096.1 2-hydroxychromene-2-carboxylate isomerase [Sinorhizobium fredii USDA 205]MQX10242.1 2-hydroxychromene-2-carboxylate isomerase [Sinorhizobium fredii]GEC33975.1 2-hydroxychromene-2-carboxylate isomerase [Sinorhizobium fredii]GLS09828.1 2-hydroxychromene-2-carboxylate isomerase [Sinorhizobium fredii]
MTAPVDFWFSIGSPYTFLAVMRLPEVAERAGVEVRWRPFDLRAIQAEANDAPFADKPLKAAYMWRDIERRAAKFGLPVRLPIPYPLADLALANRVAVLAAKEGWCSAYTIATYRRWFVDREPAEREPNIAASIEEAGEDPGRVLKQASTGAAAEALNAATSEAKEIGIFGSPSFVADGELFWGHDRLEDAIEWQHNLDQGNPG